MHLSHLSDVIPDRLELLLCPLSVLMAVQRSCMPESRLEWVVPGQRSRPKCCCMLQESFCSLFCYMRSVKSSLMTACQVNGMFGCVLSLVCFVVQVNITRPYLCANHLAAPYTGLPASAAQAPSEAPPPQSASSAAGEGYGTGVLTLMHFVHNCNVAM